VHHHLPPPGDFGLLFLASLLGGAHCAGMCGPYVAICSARLGGSTAAGRALLRGLFLGGRVAAYVAIGALAGAFGEIIQAVSGRGGVSGLLSVVAGIFAILFALSTAGLFPAPERLLAAAGLDRLVRSGAREAFHAPPYFSAALLGGLQGLLPCALVYGAASRAAASASAASGALTMLVFGLGTVPAILIFAVGGRALAPLLRLRKAAALFLGAVGVLLLLRGLAGFGLLAHSTLW
jgi:sulfite exporter TauE/SafE